MTEHQADTVSLRMVTYQGYDVKLFSGIHDSLSWADYDFAFGKSYLLNAELGKGAWALCWMVGGMVESGWLEGRGKFKKYGVICRNGIAYPMEQRRKESWVVREDEHRLFRQSGYKTGKELLERGLNQNPNPYFKTVGEYLERFKLDERMVDRPFRQMSTMAWRGSCAIGLAWGKKIFCFPYVEYIYPYFIEMFHDTWLKNMIAMLRDSGAMVLVPAIARFEALTLCDEIVLVEMRADDPRRHKYVLE